jgi:hypothetical protein
MKPFPKCTPASPVNSEKNKPSNPMEQALTNSNQVLPEITSVRSLVDIRRTQPRYRDIDPARRQSWLLEKIISCNYNNHSPKTDANLVKLDATTLDAGIMQDRTLADLTLPEIAFAMMHGTLGEYGEFYGLTARAFLGFLREFLRTDLKDWTTREERKTAAPDTGSWVIARMEHHRQQVLLERAEREERDELDERLEGWKKNIEIINSQTPKQ